MARSQASRSSWGASLEGRRAGQAGQDEQVARYQDLPQLRGRLVHHSAPMLYCCCIHLREKVSLR